MLTVCSHEKSTKELSRKERGGCDQGGSETGCPWLFALCIGEWQSWAALLGAPVHASVFGKDGAAAKAMGRSHGVALPGEISFGDDFPPWSLWSALGQRWTSVFGQHHRLQGLVLLGRVFALTTAELHLRRAKAHGEQQGLSLALLWLVKGTGRFVFRVTSVHSLQSSFFSSSKAQWKYVEAYLRLTKIDTISLQPWLCPRSQEHQVFCWAERCFVRALG